MNTSRTRRTTRLARRTVTASLGLVLAVVTAACDDAGETSTDVVDMGGDTGADTTSPPTDTTEPDATDTTQPDSADTSEADADLADTAQPDTADTTAPDTTDATDTTDPCQGVSECDGAGTRCVDNEVVECIADGVGCFVIDDTVAARACFIGTTCTISEGEAFCALPGEVDCSDQVDEDGDGLTDCDDPECAGEQVCLIEDCENALDDDLDGTVDCADPDCDAAPRCASTVEECFNAVDDDGDGLVDCDDTYCTDAAVCAPGGAAALTCTSEFHCANGTCMTPYFLCDGKADCADGSDEGPLNTVCGDCETWMFTCGDGTCVADLLMCDGFPDCPDGTDEIAALCSPEDCSNGVNDDFDAQVDCEDDDCTYDVACRTVDLPIAWQCDAERYGDGWCDCGCGAQDLDCATLEASECEKCLPGCSSSGCSEIQDQNNTACVGSNEICGNGVNDDGDLTTDCDDPDCLLHPACSFNPTEDCNDGADNDFDGAVDCADLEDCEFADNCLLGQPEDCSNGQDDDGDFWVDCRDADCWYDNDCMLDQELCLNDRDDDRDGLIDCRDPECAGGPACTNTLIEPGDIVFNELGLASTIEFIELRNLTNTKLVFDSCAIVDTEVSRIVARISANEQILAHGVFDIVAGDLPLLNESMKVPGVSFRRHGQSLALVCDGVTIDEVSWDTTWWMHGAPSVAFDQDLTTAAANDDFTNWCTSGGTPGLTNDCP